MSVLEWSVLIIAITSVLSVLTFVIGVFFAIRAINRLSRQAGPAMDEARRTLENVNRIATNVGVRVEDISRTAEDVTRNVAHRVDTTTSLLQEAFSKPVIQVTSLAVGISKGLSVWSRRVRSKGGNGRG